MYQIQSCCQSDWRKQTKRWRKHLHTHLISPNHINRSLNFKSASCLHYTCHKSSYNTISCHRITNTMPDNPPFSKYFSNHWLAITNQKRGLKFPLIKISSLKAGRWEAATWYPHKREGLWDLRHHLTGQQQH